MRLTVDLIEYSATFINAIKDREIDLRSNKIPAIENLGATKDQFDTIDLTDNDIRKLENFPILRRLRSIYASNNRITSNKARSEYNEKGIEAELQENLPQLETIILNNNLIEELGDLDSLSNVKTLRNLSLIGNPVTKKAHYRLYIIHILPFLKVLDFKKVHQSERKQAHELFGSDSAGQKLATEYSKKKTNVADSGPLTGNKMHQPTLSHEETMRIKEAIKHAKTLEEVTQLERQLRIGHIPSAKN